MPLSFMRDTVTVKRAPITTKNGMEYRNWTTEAEMMLSNVQITAQATSRDFGDRTEEVMDRRTLRAPYYADVQTGDIIVWNGERYVIDGEVFHTKSPTGRVSSTRCTLVRWKG